MKGWKQYSPADSLIISPEFELMGRQPVNEIGSPMAEFYMTFLKESLAGKLPGFGEDTTEQTPNDSSALFNADLALNGLNVVLSKQHPSQEVLNIFRAPGQGYQDYTVVEIDATAFENGGMLTINISVGHADASGSFDLYDGTSELPTKGMPDGALTSAWDIPPGKARVIEYSFSKGQVFKLGATGNWFSEKGSVNAFLAKISVEPGQKPETREASSTDPEQSPENAMNAFVKALKNLDSEALHTMLTGDARESLEIDDVPEEMRAQVSLMLSQMEVVSSQYVGDEFHFRLKVPMADPSEISFKMRKVDGVWLIYDTN